MPDAPTIGSVLASLAPVVVGGVMALVGGAGMQWYLHREKVAEDRKDKLAAKFEELVTSLYDHAHWLSTQRNIRVFGEELAELPSPFSKVQAIVALYFSQFADRVAQLESAADKYEAWMFDRGQARLDVKIKGEPLPNLGQGMEEAIQDYRHCRISLLSALQNLARHGLE